MKRNLQTLILFSIIFLTLQHQSYSAGLVEASKKLAELKAFICEGDTNKVSLRKPIGIAPENSFKFGNSSQSLSFNLKPIATRKFSVSFQNRNHSNVAVKIYDVIGNLIIEEKVIGSGYFYKEYDLSFYKTNLFIIEVGNSKYNKTKSLVAI